MQDGFFIFWQSNNITKNGISPIKKQASTRAMTLALKAKAGMNEMAFLFSAITAAPRWSLRKNDHRPHPVTTIKGFE
jgi:hypothetical protein